MPQDDDTLTGSNADDQLESNDTLDAGADDTLTGAGDDTLDAGSGDGTAAGGEGNDTAAGDADDSLAAGDGAEAGDEVEGFEQFDEADPAPAKPGKAGNARAAADRGNARDTVGAGAADDDTDEELSAIEKELGELDETLGTGGKLAGVVKKLLDRDKTRGKALKAIQSRVFNEEAWNRFEKELGITSAPAALRQKVLSRDNLQDRFEKLFKAAKSNGVPDDEARGEARATLKFEVKQIQAKHGKKKPLARVATSRNGSRLTPPGGAAARAGKPKQSAEDAFDNGNWSLPSR